MKRDAEEHFMGKVAQKAVILDGSKVLLVRDPRSPGMWELPGGRLNVGEECRAGLVREIQEELGVTVVVHEVLQLQQLEQRNAGKQTLMIAYRATFAQPNQELQLDPGEVAEARFVHLREIDNMQLFPEYERVLRSLPQDHE